MCEQAGTRGAHHRASAMVGTADHQTAERLQKRPCRRVVAQWGERRGVGDAHRGPPGAVKLEEARVRDGAAHGRGAVDGRRSGADLLAIWSSRPVTRTTLMHSRSTRPAMGHGSLAARLLGTLPTASGVRRCHNTASLTLEDPVWLGAASAGFAAGWTPKIRVESFVEFSTPPLRYPNHCVEHGCLAQQPSWNPEINHQSVRPTVDAVHGRRAAGWSVGALQSPLKRGKRDRMARSVRRSSR